MAINKGTYFYLEDNKRPGSDAGIVPIPLFKGMQITIHGHQEVVEVVMWQYHHGQEDEEAGLKIILKIKSPRKLGLGFAD